jgi:catechol 2,3-dioxygenase-like lactoylglutathione lyase family enzyme
MLSDAIVHPSLATADLAKAMTWYADKLGWRPVREFDGLVVYAVGSDLLTLFETPNAGTARNTVAIWQVEDLRAEVARLRERGVVFDDFDLGDLKTVDGIATADDGSGAMQAWFRDLDGNYIAIGEPHASEADAKAGYEPLPAPGMRAMIAASDLARAKAWYEEKLGFTPYWEDPADLLVYRAGKSHFSIYQTPSAGTAKNTVAAWRVGDLRAEVSELRSRGVVFEEYDFGDSRTVDGILVDPNGDSVAWFKDSEGNVLGLSQIRPGDRF